MAKLQTMTEIQIYVGWNIDGGGQQDDTTRLRTRRGEHLKEEDDAPRIQTQRYTKIQGSVY
jgi:hypothetical protein